jgi:hypothetical protein
MYLQALWFLVFATLLATAWLQATYATVAAAAKHAALRAANLATERAQDALIESIALQVQAGAPSYVAPTPSPPVPVCPSAPPHGAACPLQVSTEVTLAGQTGQPGSGDNQVATARQLNPAIAEQRLAAVVTATVSNAGGAFVTSLARHVTLRTFGAWPYAALSGSDEPTLDGYAVGDFAGACAGGPCGADSRIHAVLECSDPGNPSACQGQPPLPVDDFKDTKWHDANADPTGWSR